MHGYSSELPDDIFEEEEKQPRHRRSPGQMVGRTDKPGGLTPELKRAMDAMVAHHRMLQFVSATVTTLALRAGQPDSKKVAALIRHAKEYKIPPKPAMKLADAVLQWMRAEGLLEESDE